jgi:glutathione S-transferase
VSEQRATIQQPTAKRAAKQSQQHHSKANSFLSEHQSAMPLPQFDDVGHDINLYCAEHSRSGAKIAILLEELQLQYKVHHVEHPKHEPDHPVEHGLGRVPTVTLLTESASQEEGPVHIHESGHIMQYLVERYDRNHHLSYPKGSAQDIEVNNWLFFQNGKLGPAHDEAEHFVQNAPEKLPYPTEHFLSKARTFYLTLEKHLAKKGTAYLVGNKM